jgi:hypothetical protein
LKEWEAKPPFCNKIRLPSHHKLANIIIWLLFSPHFYEINVTQLYIHTYIHTYIYIYICCLVIHLPTTLLGVRANVAFPGWSRKRTNSVLYLANNQWVVLHRMKSTKDSWWLRECGPLSFIGSLVYLCRTDNFHLPNHLLTLTLTKIKAPFENLTYFCTLWKHPNGQYKHPNMSCMNLIHRKIVIYLDNCYWWAHIRINYYSQIGVYDILL